jgi:hypothetical protein
MGPIEKRIDENITIPEDLFSSGLLDTTDFLCSSLKEFLNKEERFLGIVKSYINSMDRAYENFNKDLTDEESDIYGRILFLIKPLIVREFSRLRRKKLSEGDCVIVMIRKILTIIKEEVHEYTHMKEVKTIMKVINRLYDNIRHRSKTDAMYNFSNQIRVLLKSGAVGKYQLNKLNLTLLSKDKEVYSGPESKVSSDTGKVVEISWTEEK